MLPILLAVTFGAVQFSAPQAKTELIASTTAIVPGKPFEVALHMTMAPGWHSYYINPGESGQATSIQWNLPTGFHAGPIKWPVPERLVVGGVAGYVYENEVWLTTVVTPPTNLTGHATDLSAEVKWLLCREACVLQKSTLNLFLPIVGSGIGPISSKPNSAFAPAMKGQPTFLGIEKLSVSTTKKAVSLSIGGKVSSAKGAEFFPADPTYFGSDAATATTTRSGIRLVIPLSKYAPGPPRRMTGILVIPSGEAKGAHWIDVKVTEH